MEHIWEDTMPAAFRAALLEAERSPATVEKYLRDLRAFRQFAGREPVSKPLVIRYKQFLLEHYAPASVNSMLVALNRFFREMGWFDCTVKLVKIQRQSFRPKERELSKQEYLRLVRSAKELGRQRLSLLMQTVCSTGIRISELRFITVEAVSSGFATVSLKGKTRRVLIPGSLCQKLRKYARQNAIGSGSVFLSRRGNPLDRSNILHEMKALCDRAGVQRGKVFPHNLRHLFACLYYREEKDLSRLADILGHSSVNTTRIYTAVNGEYQVRQIDRLGLVI